MNKAELQSEIDNVTMELRSLMDEVKDSSKEINVEEVRSKKSALEEKRANLVKELAEMDRPVENVKEDRGIHGTEVWMKAFKENRGITIGDAGSVLQIKSLVKEVAQNDDLLNEVSFYYGANASTNIPVLTPLSDPTAQAEGSSAVGTDSDAGVTVTKLEPYAYARVLPISAEMLSMGAVNMESEVDGIFARAFNKVIHNQILNGAGTTGTFKGLFTSAAANAGSSKNTVTGVTISKLAELAITVRGLDEQYTIVLSPATYQAILSDSSSSEDVKLYKESIIRDKSIEGVKILVDAKAPSSSTSGAIVAVAAPLSRYAVGVAGEMTIDPIKVKGDTNTYYQATMFINGKQVADSDVYGLAVA